MHQFEMCVSILGSDPFFLTLFLASDNQIDLFMVVLTDRNLLLTQHILIFTKHTSGFFSLTVS